MAWYTSYSTLFLLPRRGAVAGIPGHARTDAQWPAQHQGLIITWLQETETPSTQRPFAQSCQQRMGVELQ